MVRLRPDPQPGTNPAPRRQLNPEKKPYNHTKTVQTKGLHGFLLLRRYFPEQEWEKMVS